MSDLISRQEAIDALAKFVPYAICDESTESYTNGLTDAYNLICQLPTIQPKRGRWKRKAGGVIWCSNCHEEYKNQLTMMGKPMFEFCPCCGADMRGGEDAIRE